MSRPVWKVALLGMALLVMGEVSASYLAAQTPPHHLLHRLQPPLGKEHLVNDLLLREVVERMGRDLDSYLESRADKEAALSDYELPEEGVVPSIRDQEYLRHSSLWPSRYVQQEEEDERAPDDPERLQHHQQDQDSDDGGGSRPKMKQHHKDNTLPAYCNPPNPCPVGYIGNQGCLEDFENTAAFSREFQAKQECMCDSEHMFECGSGDGGGGRGTGGGPNGPQSSSPSEEINRFVQQYQNWNPFLLGEKLPVAAKKGQNVFY